MPTTGPYIFSPDTISNRLKIANGQVTTVTANDTVASGLSVILSVSASFDDDPSLGLADVSISLGDQIANPVAGSFKLKTWKSTSSADCTPIAATVFGKKVNWVAVGY